MTLDKPLTGRAARAQDAESVAARTALDEWQKDLSANVVREILRYRELRKISNEELRARLASLGWDLTKDSLASILGSKRKSMPLGDILLFAQALNVPPVALMTPIASNAHVSLYPGDEEPISAYETARWISGKFPWVSMPFKQEFVTDDYYEIGDIVSRLEDLDEDLHAVDAMHRRLVHNDLSPEDRAIKEQELTLALRDVAEQRTFLRSVHKALELPPLRPALQFLDERDPLFPGFPLEDYDQNAWERDFHAQFDPIRDAPPADPGK